MLPRSLRHVDWEREAATGYKADAMPEKHYRLQDPPVWVRHPRKTERCLFAEINRSLPCKLASADEFKRRLGHADGGRRGIDFLHLESLFAFIGDEKRGAVMNGGPGKGNISLQQARNVVVKASGNPDAAGNISDGRRGR